MPNRATHAIALIVVFTTLTTTALAAGPNDQQQPPNWPQFRGRQASGLGDAKTPLPQSFDVASGKNIAWKIDTPGLGFSSPVIWGDQIFLTTAVRRDGSTDDVKVGLYGQIQPASDGDTEYEWKLLCLSAADGKTRWEKTCHRGKPAVQRHTKASHANSTPATDGEHLLAFFGSEGLHCFAMDGKKLWSKNFGTLDSGFYMVPSAQWGFGSSPVIHDGKVIIVCDVQKDSFLACLDIKTGNEIWRTPRNEVPTWSSPTVTECNGKPIIIVNGYKHAGAYEFETGKPLWKIGVGGDIPVPTPIVAHGLTFITNAHGMFAPMYAVKLDAKGDLSPINGGAKIHEDMAWAEMAGGAYMQTPLVYGDYLYSCRDNGVLTCWEAKTGTQMYKQRLAGGRTGFTASPVAGDGKIYFTSEEGSIFTIKAGPEFEQLAESNAGDVCMATPAICDGVIYIRTQKGLLAVKKGA